MRSMLGMQALVVVGQNLDDPALADAAMSATADHRLKFVSQSHQAFDAGVDLG